jgi:hypothetical protein
MRPISFWKDKSMSKITPKPKLELPKTRLNLSKETKDLVRLGVGIAVAGAALGVGLAAFEAAQD